MNLTDEHRDKIYEKASSAQRYLYGNPNSGLKLMTIAQKYDLHHDEIYKKFAITVGDIILGFYRIEDTVPLLQQELGLDPRTAALLGADVLDFLAPLSDPNWQPPADLNEMQSNIQPETAPLPERPYTTENVPPQERSLPIQSEIVPGVPFVERPNQSDTAPQSVSMTPPIPAAPMISTPLAGHIPQSPASPFDTPRPMPPTPVQTPQYNFEPVHQSTQPNTRPTLSDIPSYQPPVTTTPPPPPIDQPRWETS